MRRLITGILLSLSLFNAWALEIDYSNDSKVAAGIRLGSSTFPTLDVEILGEYRPFRYVGANAGVIIITPFSNKVNSNVEFVEIEDEEERKHLWEIKSYRNAAYRFAFKAGLQFTTPAIMLSKNEMGLSLRLSPGITIPLPTNETVTVRKSDIFTKEDIYGDDADDVTTERVVVFNSEEDFKNSGAKALYWYARAELVIEYEEQWEFAVGYTYSNLDLYGGSRSIVVHDTPLVKGEKEPMHSFHLGLTYKF
ncbi:MAG: hypothetical protein IJK68_06200 [Muribaculaceae bacterium]|nr:hypothetical protein [Muribaculaceae bacterium]